MKDKNLIDPSLIQQMYENGENITDFLKNELESATNNEEIIEMAYDMQSGSYIEAMNQPEMYSHKEAYGAAIASAIEELTIPESILEPGVGEGTTLAFVINAMKKRPSHVHGFDISWSRISHCRRWLSRHTLPDAKLSVASILNFPYQDNSFDVVYTSHTIEPNGGSEDEILEEMYRVASQYLVLLEPGYDFANEEARERMERLGYCRNLRDRAIKLGMKVVKHELFPHIANPLNPTAITIIKKETLSSEQYNAPVFSCPVYQTPLAEGEDSLFTAKSLRAYPKIKGIPCLRKDDGVVASAYNEF